MNLTRRQFAAASTSFIALTILGCDNQSASQQSSAGAAQEPTPQPDAPSIQPPNTNGTTPGASPGATAAQPATGTSLKDNQAKLATAPFTIGPIDQYKTAGVYLQHKDESGVWIVSDGKQLTVLSATCTHMGCTTHYDQPDRHFYCPCHKSTFDLAGGNLEGKSKRPLERCTLSLVDGLVHVDPTQRLRQERGEWEAPGSSLTF